MVPCGEAACLPHFCILVLICLSARASARCHGVPHGGRRTALLSHPHLQPLYRNGGRRRGLPHQSGAPDLRLSATVRGGAETQDRRADGGTAQHLRYRILRHHPPDAQGRRLPSAHLQPHALRHPRRDGGRGARSTGRAASTTASSPETPGGWRTRSKRSKRRAM